MPPRLRVVPRLLYVRVLRGDERNAPDVGGCVSPAALGQDHDRTGTAGGNGPAALGHNGTWFQGVPCVYVSPDSPAEARLADAVAYLVRTSADRTRRAEVEREEGRRREGAAPTRSRSGRDSRPSLKRKFLDEAVRERSAGGPDRSMGPTERAGESRPDLKFDVVLERAAGIAGSSDVGSLVSGGPSPRLSDHALLLRAVRCISDDGVDAAAIAEASRGMVRLCSSRPADPVAGAVGRNLALALARRMDRRHASRGDGAARSAAGEEEAAAADAYAALRAVLDGGGGAGRDALPRIRTGPDGAPFDGASIGPAWSEGGGAKVDTVVPANGRGRGGAVFRACDEALLGVLRSMR